ncbi:MAG: hypothetical protein ACP5NV_03875 [Candidatus Woesearchaeota archaeon]
MKRKILRAGRSSLAISIPNTFVKNNSLKYGQEIEVIQHGATLTITCSNPKSSLKKVDITDLNSEHNEKIIDKLLGALFKQGADDFEITSKDQKKIEIIQSIIRNGKLNMYEEPKIETDHSVLIHSSISQFDDKTLENMTEVIIKYIYLSLDALIQLIKEDKLNAKTAQELISRDKTINDHSDICRRIINKNVLDYKSTSFYNFIDKAEKIGDEVKMLVDYSQKNSSAMKKYLSIIEGMKELIYILFTTNNHFSIKKMNNFYEKLYFLDSEMKNCKEIFVYHNLKSIIALTKDIYSDLMVKNL